MAGKSNIEWTEHTWNPIVGCSVLTPGCTNCYAMKMAARIEMMKPSHYDGTTRKVKGNAVWTGKLALAPDSILLEPLRRKKPTTYFVNSMGDLFHEDAPDEWIDKVFAVMALTPHHTYQILTKRAERMRDYFTALHPAPNVNAWAARVCGAIDAIVPERTVASVNAKISVSKLGPLTNVWLGVSTERQQEADERIPLLLQTPAAVRFISAEPLLGPIDLTKFSPVDADWNPRAAAVGNLIGLDWVIVGGESGASARPMHPDWARSLRDQCAAAGVPMFFKQHGEYRVEPTDQYRDKEHTFCTKDWDYVRLGKKAAGRLLDGVEHNEMPNAERPFA